MSSRTPPKFPKQAYVFYDGDGVVKKTVTNAKDVTAIQTGMKNFPAEEGWEPTWTGVLYERKGSY